MGFEKLMQPYIRSCPSAWARPEGRIAILLDENQPTQPAPEVQPVPFATLYQRAVFLLRQGKYGQAEAICDKLVNRFPRNFPAVNLAGVVALRQRRFEDAVKLLTRASALNPSAPGTYNVLGEAYRNLNKLELALENYSKAIALKPDVPAGYNNRAIVLYQLKRFRRALWNCDKAIALKPDFSVAHLNRGNALRAIKQQDEALNAYNRAIEISPKFVKCLINRGTLFHEMGRFEDSLRDYDEAIALAPSNSQPYYNRGNTLRELGRIHDAIASYDEAVARRAKYPQALWNQGNCLLLLGDYEHGLPKYENRINKARTTRREAYKTDPWIGEQDISGKTLFIYPELYLGDMIQFGRFAKLAEERGAKVVLAAQPRLLRLLRSMSPTIELIADDAPPPQFDFHCPLMSLPYAFRTTLESIYAPVPYLHAEGDRVEKWKQKIGNEGFKIGICWQGSTKAYAERLKRSFPLTLFHGISKLPNVRLISLQKYEGLDQLENLPEGMRVETLGDDFDEGEHAFLDTAAALESLDLLITTDTAIVHLAGALGRPAWLATKKVPDWRWLLERPDSPWYPTLRLFRQKESGDWQSVFDAMEDALAAKLGQRA